MKKKTLIFIVLGSIVTHTYTSAQTPRAFEQAAQVALERNDYYTAFKYYGKVLEMEPLRTDVMVQYADAARLYGAYRDAELYYENALKANNTAGGKYNSALFGLALVKKNLGKYDEALNLFERYTTRPDSDPDLKKKADSEIVECEWAMEKMTNPDKLVQLKPLEAMYNTGESEMGMVQFGDTLFFSALHLVDWGDKHLPARPLLQVMKSVKDGPPELAYFNREKMHTALPAFSPDGKFMVIPYGTYASETDVRCHLYWSKRENGHWTTPAPLPAFVNLPEATQTQPAISKDKDGYYTLYYISDAQGGKGGKDLWAVRFSQTGTFARPENLSALNTNQDEATPFFDAASQYLYFSSNGYPNLGGYDIYKIQKLDNGWAKPQHLPNPINSGYNDLYYMPTSKTHAHLTSNRIGAAILGEESCCYDLFDVEISSLRLNLAAYEQGTDQLLNEVVYTLIEDKKTPNLKFSPAPQPVEYAIERDQTYRIFAAKDGYIADTIVVSALELEPSKTEISDKLYLKPMQVDLAVQVFNQFSKEPLTGVNIMLMERTGKVKDHKNTGDRGHGSGLKADYKHDYVVIATKEGYEPDTVVVSALEMSKPGTKVLKNLFLTPVSLYGLLPLAIYFDNNVPPRSANLQKESYDLNYQNYIARRDEFIASFTQHIAQEEERQAASERINQFFETDVKGGFMKLEHFAENLDLFLGNGYEVEIMVKGFASPLASHEYNLALTHRRIVSVKNYLRAAKGGIYANYIVKNQLKISTAPMGEAAAATFVNDNARQKELSVYSVEASKERRAEIIEVRMTKL